MSNLDSYREQHSELLLIAGEIRHLLLPERIPEKAEIIQELVAQLARRSLAHMLLEDRSLYQEMLMSDHDRTRMLAQQHTISMGNLTQRMREYFRDWAYADQIAARPAQFCNDTREILNHLEDRIRCEESYLYPATEQLISL